MDPPFSLDALLAARAAAGRPYAEVLRVEAFSVGVYELGVGAEDLQRPHSEDELYAVLRGKAAFTMAGETHPVAPGALLYVPAGVPHRFHDIEEESWTLRVRSSDLETWVSIRKAPMASPEAPVCPI